MLEFRPFRRSLSPALCCNRLICFKIKDFGRYLMVQAANMKLTVEKESLTIVNISGGGCPDVPYLAEQMVGKSLERSSEPPRDWAYPLWLCPSVSL